MTVTNTTPPVVTGTPRVGQVLTSSDGTWTFDDDFLTYEYQWRRCDASGASCVDIVGEEANQYLVDAADVGSTLRSQVTATENVGAPPAGDELLYTPPGYPSYSGYTHINITNVNTSGNANGASTGCRRNLSAGVDYVVHMPNEPITVEGGVLLNGGRNVVVIGGEINDTHVQISQPASGNTWKQIGLYIPNSTGTVHLEGLYIHGVGSGDGIGLPSTAARFQIQNCRIEPQHFLANPSWPNVHPDGLQTWSGPRELKMYQCTIKGTGTIRTFQPHTFGVTTIDSMSFIRQNWVHSGNVYAIWDDSDAGNFWPEYHEDIWFQTNASHGGASFHSIHRDGNCNASVTCFNPGGPGPITGENIKWGLRPEGDWVPASMVTAGDYVSPGYV